MKISGRTVGIVVASAVLSVGVVVGANAYSQQQTEPVEKTTPTISEVTVTPTPTPVVTPEPAPVAPAPVEQAPVVEAPAPVEQESTYVPEYDEYGTPLPDESHLNDPPVGPPAPEPREPDAPIS